MGCKKKKKHGEADGVIEVVVSGGKVRIAPLSQSDIDPPQSNVDPPPSLYAFLLAASIFFPAEPPQTSSDTPSAPYHAHRRHHELAHRQSLNGWQPKALFFQKKRIQREV